MRNYVDIAKILSQSSHCDLEFFFVYYNYTWKKFTRPERNSTYWFTDTLLFLLSVLQIMFRVNSLNLDNLLILQNCILLFVYVWRQKI